MQKHIYLLFIILCGSLPVLAATPNRTLPPHTPPRVELALPDNPSVDDLRQVRLFAEPLIPVGRPPSPEENRRLAAILRPHAQRAVHDDFSHLEKFIADHPDAPWTPSLLFNLGMDYYRTGFYSKALPTLEKAWALLKDATDPTAKALADRAAGELAMLYGRMSRVAELSALLASLENRVLVGSATEKVAGARQGLRLMQDQPASAFRCGPLALDRIRAQRSPLYAADMLVYEAHATTNGYSLAQLARLSLDLGMHYRMAYRTNGSPLCLPVVVHWKNDHYAALVREENGLYQVQDPTFLHDVWVSRRVLDEEGTGYFLLPSDFDLPKGWRTVSDAEGSTIWGKGPTSKASPPDPCHKTTKDDCDKKKKCKKTSAKGMPDDSVDLVAVSLEINDSPLGYMPPVGPEISFDVTYNQREDSQPAVFSYSNLGAKWTFNWLAYISDNPSSPSADVSYYTDGGGSLAFAGYSSTSQTYAVQVESLALLKRTSATSYEMLFPDGSKSMFAQPDSAGGTSRRVFLTQIVDPLGNAAQISYDASFRVIALTDAIGQVTTFSYQNASDSLKITTVTDPFGRFTALEYDAAGRLWRITDCAGLASTFSYDASGNVQAMTTPYGSTSFAWGESGRTRWLETTYPSGEKERVESSESTTIGLPYSVPASTVPAGMSTFNQWMYARNTFYWDRKLYAEASGDYSKARLYHWLHSTDMQSTVGVLESEKEPLENRVWYNYPGQPQPQVIGSSSQPTVIGRVMDDGSTQIRRFTYNALGHVTNSVDPLGRSMTYIYSTNSVDLLEARQTTGTNNVILGKFLYNDQHLPTAIWDAAGQMTTNTYNTRGQLTATTNPRNETTAYTYDTNGYLLAVDGPLPGTNDSTRFTYDAVGRVQTITSPDGYTLAYRYDNLDRLTNVAYPDGTFTAFTYDRLDRVKSRDRLGRETLFAYDALRHLSSVQDPLNRVTRFEYCGCGSMSGLIDPMGRRTTWDYDLQGRLAAKTYVDGSRVTYAYETTTSRLKSVCDEKGQYKFYDYYADDNRRRVSYPNAQVATPTVTFTYDTNYNRMLTMQDGIGLTAWSYYPPGVPGALQVAAVDGPWDNDTVTYQYDALGRVTNRAINGGPQTWTYDALGRTTNVVNALGSFAYAYDGVTPRVRDVAYHYEGVQGRSGMFVKLGGQILASCSVPTWSSSNFIPVQVVLTTSGKVTVSVNGTNVINEASTPFLPIVNGRFGFYARTGGAYESHSVDDVKIILTIGDTPPETSNTGFQSGMQESYVAYGTTSDAGILATNGTSVFLQLTAGRTNQAGSFVVANLAINLPLSAFVATFKMRISDTSSDPADGFSFNFANDLPFAARDLGDNENGVGTGLSVCYKAYHYEGVQGRSGMFLKFGGQILASNSVPTWNSSSFVQVQVILAAGGKVTVCVDGTNVFSAVDTPFLPVANGRFGFFARTGGQYESHSIDDVNISWLPITGAGGGRSISVAGDVISYSPPKDCGLDALYYIVSDGLYNGYGIGTATVVVATGRLLGINSPASVLLETDGGGCTASAVVLGTPAISGACATVVVTNDAPTQFPSGTNLVVWTVVDAQDNTATATQLVVVVDATPPSVTCPGNMIASSDTGQNFRSNVTYLATASDNCTVTKVTCEPPSGSMFSLGTTTVTCTATDSSGNTAQCSFAVTIRDAESPRLSCPANLLLSANTSLCSRSNVAYHVTATDNCAVTNVACAPPDGSTFTVGEHRVLCIATDAAGNSAQCAFTVTVTDDESPQISCPSDLFLGRDAGQSARSNVIYAATATDNCTVTNLSCVPPSGSTFPVGSNRVDCTASDSSGHRAACAFNVVVADFLISAANEQVNARVPDGSPLGLVSSLEVSSPIERVTDVSLVLQISGGFNGDLFAYLVHGSNHAILLNRPGKTLVNPLGYADAGLTVTLNDAAAHGDIHAYRQTLFGNSTPPLAGPLPGLWAPDGRDADPALVLDTEPRTATLSAFSGFNPNGRWTLFIADMDAGYTSTLVSWGLEIHGTNAPPVQALPPLSISWPEGLGLSLEGRGTAGQSCILQTSSNLFDWLDYTNLFANTNGWFRFQEPLLTNLPSLFYRLRGP